MLDGDIFLEGISLRDDIYDGLGSKWDRQVILDQHQPIVNQQQLHTSLLTSSSSSQGSTVVDRENVVNIFHRSDHGDGEREEGEDGGGGGGGNDEGNDDEGRVREDNMSDWDRDSRSKADRVLTSGLGKLTDKIEGANSFTMDIGYGLGKATYFLLLFPLSFLLSVSISLCLLTSPCPPCQIFLILSVNIVKLETHL